MYFYHSLRLALEQLAAKVRSVGMKSKHPWIMPAILVLAALACNLQTSAPPSLVQQTALPSASVSAFPSVPPTLLPEVTYQPMFEPAACGFSVPAGYSPECGYLVVPEDRSRSDSSQIRLHVAIFRNRIGVAVSDPVVHLAGGPGSSSLEVADYIFSRGLGAILDRQDFILFDQRGTGLSQPRLDCPERASITGILLERGLTAEGSDQLILDAFRRCRDRLVGQGIDLSAYHSAASAADLNDLRITLGYERLHLYGVSYGTRLALTMMRDYPQAVRSAVLDSVYPPQVNLYTALAPNADRAFDVFFQRCAANPACETSYPDLRNTFYQLVDELNLNPVPLSFSRGSTGQLVRIDGSLLIDVLFVGLYNPAVSASMPQMIYDVRRGNYDRLKERLALYFDSSSALGMQMSVQCAEELPFNAAEEAYALAQNVQPQIAGFFPASVQPLFAICKEWSNAAPDPRENLPVSSDIPTLTLAGNQDPITPPEWGRMASQALSHAYFHEFPGQGHWVTRSSNCALSMALAFWNDPAVDPGYVCQ